YIESSRLIHAVPNGSFIAQDYSIVFMQHIFAIHCGHLGSLHGLSIMYSAAGTDTGILPVLIPFLSFLQSVKPPFNCGQRGFFCSHQRSMHVLLTGQSDANTDPVDIWEGNFPNKSFCGIFGKISGRLCMMGRPGIIIPQVYISIFTESINNKHPIFQSHHPD
ncbi:hypothetical protein STEG23_023010, partial [Scotinomys teguina]